MRFDWLARGAVVVTFSQLVACSEPQVAYKSEKHVGEYHIAFAADPLIIGERNEATVTLMRDGNPVEGAVVTLGLSMPKMSMPESVATLRSQGGGRYAGHVSFPMSGHWLARVAAHTSGDTDVRSQFDFSTRDR